MLCAWPDGSGGKLQPALHHTSLPGIGERTEVMCTMLRRARTMSMVVLLSSPAHILDQRQAVPVGGEAVAEAQARPAQHSPVEISSSMNTLRGPTHCSPSVTRFF